MARRLRWDDPEVYALVEARRQQWDLLLWQVPLLTLTGQAFLFTIVLGPSTTSIGRTAAAAISIGVAWLSLLLLARQRQAELADSHWLHRYEVDAEWPEGSGQHGADWVARRDAIRPDRGQWGRIVPLLPGYRTWVVAHYALMLVAAGSIVLTWVYPAALEVR